MRNNPNCPECGRRMAKNGVRNGRVRWRCWGCGNTHSGRERAKGRPRLNPARPSTSTERSRRHRERKKRKKDLT